MPKPRPPYPPELRRRMVELVRSGRSPESLAEGYEPTGESIRNWVRQADRDEGKRRSGFLARKASSDPLPEPLSMFTRPAFGRPRECIGGRKA